MLVSYWSFHQDGSLKLTVKMTGIVSNGAVDGSTLPPYLTRSYKRETKAVREQARENLDDESNALLAKLRQMRGQQ